MFTCFFYLHIVYKQVTLWPVLVSTYLCKCKQIKMRSFGFKTKSTGNDVLLLFFPFSLILQKNIFTHTYLYSSSLCQ